MATVIDVNAYGQADIVDVDDKPDYTDLLTFLQSQEQGAVNTSLDDDRKTALDFYNGEPYGNEEEGRSQVVTRDVAEVIDYMTTSVLRTMVSGDRIVEFEACYSSDKDSVEQANEAVAQQFMRMQDGYRVLHDSLKAGLLEKTGVVKTAIEYKPKRETVEVFEPQLAIMQEQGIEVVSVEEMQPAQVDEMGVLTPAFVRAVVITRIPEFPDMPIPNEEFLCAKDARSLEESIYYAHKMEKTVSDLREMGFAVDENTIQYGDTTAASTTLSDARDADGATGETTYRTGANRLCWLMEEYARFDLNGDGISELLLVHRVGTEILSVNEIEFGLCEEWCPFPMQHRRVGQSLADKCMDIQLVRSVLLRQSLDNLYLSNAPRTLMHENSIGATTIDDTLSVVPGGIVRWSGNVEPKPLVTPFIAQSSFDAMEFMAGERESRTGITRMNQGLDSDALSKTATGQAMMQAAGQQIEEYVARNFAEFIGRVFRKKYKLMREFGEPFAIVIDGQAVMADPKQWPEDIRVKVRVGLGSGRKEQRIQNRMTVLQLQQAAAQSDIPITNAMIFNSIDGLVRDLGLGSGTDYWPAPTPENEPQQNEGPPPEVQIKMAELQAKQQQNEADNMLKARQQEVDAALKQQQTEYDLAAKREKAALDEQLAREKAAFEADLAERQFQFEAQMAIRQQEFNEEMSRKSAAAKSEQAELPNKRPGGDLDK
jgi:hypothetical protein